MFRRFIKALNTRYHIDSGKNLYKLCQFLKIPRENGEAAIDDYSEISIDLGFFGQSDTHCWPQFLDFFREKKRLNLRRITFRQSAQSNQFSKTAGHLSQFIHALTSLEELSVLEISNVYFVDVLGTTLDSSPAPFKKLAVPFYRRFLVNENYYLLAQEPFEELLIRLGSANGNEGNGASPVGSTEPVRIASSLTKVSADPSQVNKGKQRQSMIDRQLIQHKVLARLQTFKLTHSLLSANQLLRLLEQVASAKSLRELDLSDTRLVDEKGDIEAITLSTLLSDQHPSKKVKKKAVRNKAEIFKRVVDCMLRADHPLVIKASPAFLAELEIFRTNYVESLNRKPANQAVKKLTDEVMYFIINYPWRLGWFGREKRVLNGVTYCFPKHVALMFDTILSAHNNKIEYQQAKDLLKKYADSALKRKHAFYNHQYLGTRRFYEYVLKLIQEKRPKPFKTTEECQDYLGNILNYIDTTILKLEARFRGGIEVYTSQGFRRRLPHTAWQIKHLLENHQNTSAQEGSLENKNLPSFDCPELLCYMTTAISADALDTELRALQSSQETVNGKNEVTLQPVGAEEEIPPSLENQQNPVVFEQSTLGQSPSFFRRRTPDTSRFYQNILTYNKDGLSIFNYIPLPSFKEDQH